MTDQAAASLQKAVEAQHGGTAILAQTVPVHETVDGQVVWDGTVHVFDLDGHPTATRAYAWSSPIEGSNKRRFYAVLHLGGIRSPLDAVRAAIVAERRAKQRVSRRYQFRIRESQFQQAQSPELHFAFALRKGDRWRFLVMDRAVLRNYVQNQSLGTAASPYRQFAFVLHDDGRCICSSVDLKSHISDWATWPVL